MSIEALRFSLRHNSTTVAVSCDTVRAALAEYDRLRGLLATAERLLVDHGDPFRGDDWQAVQDIRAALTQGAEKEGA